MNITEETKRVATQIMSTFVTPALIALVLFFARESWADIKQMRNDITTMEIIQAKHTEQIFDLQQQLHYNEINNGK